MKPSRRPDRHCPADVRDRRRRRLDRDRREAALILVECANCTAELGEVPVGVEVRCPGCGSWARAVGATNVGVAAWK